MNSKVLICLLRKKVGPVVERKRERKRDDSVKRGVFVGDKYRDEGVRSLQTHCSCSDGEEFVRDRRSRHSETYVARVSKDYVGTLKTSRSKMSIPLTPSPLPVTSVNESV